MPDAPNLPATTSTDHVLAILGRFPAFDLEEVAERTLARTMTATSLDEVLADPEAASLADLAGHVIVVNEVLGVLPSSFEGRFGVYLVLDVTDKATGERMVVSCGGDFVIARVARAVELGELPFNARVVGLQSRSNPNQTSLWLVRP